MKYKQKKKLLKNKGVTLVALIVTLIVLVMLTGITIFSLSNSNLFDKTKLAKDKWISASKTEENIINEMNNNIAVETITRENNTKWQFWKSGTRLHF